MNKCTPICSKHRQADVLETLLYTRMHTNMLKIPSGRRFGDFDLIFGLSLRAQNAVRQVFYVKMFRSAACAHGREARRVLGAFITRNTTSVPLVPFRVHSRVSSAPLPGLAFARPHPLRFTSPKSLFRGSKFLIMRKVCG